MDTYNPNKLTAAPKKVDISLRQLADFDQTGGDRNRVDNVRDNQVLVSLSNINRPKTFSFKYISDLLLGGTGITISTDKDGITTISASGGGGSTSTVKHLVKLAQNISKGQAVYVTGATGTNMLVSKADYTTEATSSKVMGLLETGGVINDQVNVITEGLLAGVNTITATIGDPVWLGASGNLIFGLLLKPYAPLHLVYIGVVTRVHAVNGEIFVQPQNGFELKEIHDVQLVNQKDGEAIIYNAASGLWKNTDIESLMIAYSVAL
jgi:hypothetical protein